MSSETEVIYDMRLMREADIPFVMSTFLKGVYYGNTNHQLVEKDIFMANYKLLAQVLIDSSAVIVACLKDDHDVILGYSIVSPDTTTAHWVFVKKAWRGRGIGRALIPAVPQQITHFTHSEKETPKEGLNKFLRKFVGCIYNPFAIG